MSINAKGLHFKELNEQLKKLSGDLVIDEVLGQRFIGAGQGERKITVNGTPGNALGAYLDGAIIEVNGNAQDATGDTMNNGRIIVHGNIGDAAGYAMRGGKIMVSGNAGYRAGIHMKAYKDHSPVIIIGGRAGNFLGEYQAGGTIIVLGLNKDSKPIIGGFPCTGMHGGKLVLRSDCGNLDFSDRLLVRRARSEDLAEIREELTEYCDVFSLNIDEIMDSTFTIVEPNSANPYNQLYVPN